MNNSILATQMPLWVFVSQEKSKNRVLSLGGDGDYVQLPSDIFNELDSATVAGWVRWEKFGYDSRFFDFGNERQMMLVSNVGSTSSLSFKIGDQNQRNYEIDVTDILQLNEWYHIAAVSGKAGMRLYFNGVLVGENDYTGSFSLNFPNGANWSFRP